MKSSLRKDGLDNPSSVACLTQPAQACWEAILKCQLPSPEDKWLVRFLSCLRDLDEAVGFSRHVYISGATGGKPLTVICLVTASLP